MWLNNKGITNLLLIPQLETDGSRVTTDTLKEWVVYTPQGEKVVFKCDIDLCRGMSYIDVQEYTPGFALTNTKKHQKKGL